MKATVPLFSPLDYAKSIKLSDKVSATFYNAGHVLGSAMIKLEARSGDKVKTLIFSGDIGRWQDPIMEQPASFDTADDIVMESTYGGLSHETEEEAAAKLARIINDTIKAGGNIVIPSFALERAQNVLYYLNRFLVERQIPKLLVFLDSPMAIDITSVFSHHPEFLNTKIRQMLASGLSPFGFPELTLVSSAEQSKAINHIKGSSIIIAGSGMATGGRIKHHLVNNISRPESSIVFVGYQAAGTLGRQITDGAKEVRVLGQNYPVRARIEKLDGFSAHADSGEMLNWLSALKRPPDNLFIVHSEAAVAQQFEKLVASKFGWHSIIPGYKQEFTL